MDSFAHLIKETIPNYLRGLPLPNSITGLFKLSGPDWLQLTPLLALLTLPSYYITQKYILKSSDSGPPESSRKVNLNVKKDCPKVVDTADIEDILSTDTKKKVFCRCWRSKQFPYCDGAHVQHNEITGDNVGPLIVKG